ncbi:MAG: hypothetical protein IKH54_06335 [Bacilli bacterium]|nr:hypothetical protein [Bacilli bacterium]
MINYYYNKTNVRSLFLLVITIIGIITSLLNYYFISVLLLIINVIFNEDIYVRDIFIQYKNDLFLLKYKEYLWFKGIIILVLLITFLLLFSSNYYLFILIFYIVLLSISIYNFVISFLNKNTIKILNIDEVLDNSIKIKSSIKKSNYYILNDDIEYRINRSFCEYNKLRKLL